MRWRKGQTLEPDWQIDQDGWVIQIDGRPTVTLNVGFLPPPDFEAETIADFMVLGHDHDAAPASTRSRPSSPPRPASPRTTTCRSSCRAASSRRPESVPSRHTTGRGRADLTTFARMSTPTIRRHRHLLPFVLTAGVTLPRAGASRRTGSAPLRVRRPLGARCHRQLGGSGDHGRCEHSGRRCAATIDRRDAALSRAAVDAWLSVGRGSADRRRADRRAARGLARRVRCPPRSVGCRRGPPFAPPPLDVPDGDAWAVVLEAGDLQIACSADALRRCPNRTGRRPSRRIPSPSINPTPIHFAAALTALELGGRDCETMWTHPGTPTEHATFVAEAAAACRSIVDRRRARDFAATSDTLLAGLAAIVSDREPDDAALGEALEVAIDEWTETGTDFAAVTGAPPDDAAWAELHALPADRVAGLERRLDALRSGDATAIEAAFSPDVFGITGVDLAALDLDLRDCRSVVW